MTRGNAVGDWQHTSEDRHVGRAVGVEAPASDAPPSGFHPDTDHRTRSRQKESELTRQTTDLRKAVEIARKNLASLHEENKTLKEQFNQALADKEKAMKNEIRYKKKASAHVVMLSTFISHASTQQYHALRQEQDRLKRARVGMSAEIDDDSLIVL